MRLTNVLIIFACEYVALGNLGKYTVIYFLFFAVGAGLEASLAVLLFFAVIEVRLPLNILPMF